MLNFIVITHGEFGAYLVEAAESIVGRQERGVRAIPVTARASVPEIRERVVKAIQELASPDGLVVFVDMPGGTPANVAFPLLKGLQRAELVTGVNLYMLVSAFSNRNRLPIRELVEKAIVDGQRSIKDVRQMVLAKAA